MNKWLSDRVDYNKYNDYRDSDLDLDLDWERFSELVTKWQGWLLLTNCETSVMALRVSDLQSVSDLDSIRNSYDVLSGNQQPALKVVLLPKY